MQPDPKRIKIPDVGEDFEQVELQTRGEQFEQDGGYPPPGRYSLNMTLAFVNFVIQRVQADKDLKGKISGLGCAVSIRSSPDGQETLMAHSGDQVGGKHSVMWTLLSEFAEGLPKGRVKPVEWADRYSPYEDDVEKGETGSGMLQCAEPKVFRSSAGESFSKLYRTGSLVTIWMGFNNPPKHRRGTQIAQLDVGFDLGDALELRICEMDPCKNCDKFSKYIVTGSREDKDGFLKSSYTTKPRTHDRSKIYYFNNIGKNKSGKYFGFTTDGIYVNLGDASNSMDQHILSEYLGKRSPINLSFRGIKKQFGDRLTIFWKDWS